MVFSPLLRPGFIQTDDGNWMVIRLSSFYQSLREGQFPVRFLGRLNNSYGYPVANFLYPGYLYIGSFLHFVGFSFVDAVKIIILSSMILGSFFIFLWLRMFVYFIPAIFGSIVYMASPYMLFDVFKRGSVGEVLALAFASLGLYAIEKKLRWLLPFAIFLLILSHNSLALLFCLFFLILLFVRKDVLGCVSFFLGFGMATFFWFPAIYEKTYVGFDTTIISQPHNYFASGDLLYLLNIPILVIFLYSIFTFRHVSKVYIVAFVSAIFFATPLSYVFWHTNELSKLFQFPFRMLALSVVLSPYFFALALEHNKNIFRFFLAGAVIFLMYVQTKPLYTNIQHINYPDEYYATNEATTTVADEYMPRWVKESPSERSSVRMIIHEGRGKIDFDVATTQKIRAKVFAEEESILQINSIYYPGWGVLVNNLPVPLTYDNPNGLIRFSVEQGEHVIFAEFRETFQRFMANCISIATFFVYFIFVFRLHSLSRRVFV
ncbi:MAG: hypothetical protein N3A54_03950 [Patescibacteria group bacterium]|nr:hypothetical protein [Patescibacteria group bacterium]